MLGAVVKLLLFALIVNPNFLAILERRRGRVARSATPERSGGSPAVAEKSPKNFAGWGVRRQTDALFSILPVSCYQGLNAVARYCSNVSRS